MVAVAYKATNSKNGKCYVGITIRFETRKGKHIWEAKNGSPLKFHTAIRKHGEESFSWEILGNYATYNDALEAERIFILNLRPEYNMTAGGGGVYGYKFSDASRQKMSLAKKGKPSPWSNGAMPQSVRNKLSAFRKSENRSLSDKGRIALRSNAQKANVARRRSVFAAHDNNRTFPSVTAAANFYGVCTSTICHSLSGRKSRRGFEFRYTSDG